MIEVSNHLVWQLSDNDFIKRTMILFLILQVKIQLTLQVESHIFTAMTIEQINLRK
jgi:hypothetical protein